MNRLILRRLVVFRHWFQRIGREAVLLFEQAGALSLLLAKCFTLTITGKVHWKPVWEQMYKIGVLSLPLVSMTALFTGMVLALQSAYQLRYLQAVQFTADLVALSITRELGPVLTAMVVAGRVGAGITAEIGSMKVTEQLDAMRALATDPTRYLALPRIIAAFFMLFILTVYADFLGIFGGYLIGIFKLDISSAQYIDRTFDSLVLKDVYTGLIKAFFFGVIIATVGCYHGFQARGGAEGVGRATTKSVVSALVLIIAFDCFFTAFFYFIF